MYKQLLCGSSVIRSLNVWRCKTERSHVISSNDFAKGNARFKNWLELIHISTDNLRLADHIMQFLLFYVTKTTAQIRTIQIFSSGLALEKSENLSLKFVSTKKIIAYNRKRQIEPSYNTNKRSTCAKLRKCPTLSHISSQLTMLSFGINLRSLSPKVELKKFCVIPSFSDQAAW